LDEKSFLCPFHLEKASCCCWAALAGDLLFEQGDRNLKKKGAADRTVSFSLSIQEII